MPSLLIALALLATLVAGCDTQFDLNECDSAPAPPTDDDYLNLEPGTAVVDGPEGRLNMPAQVLLTPPGEREYVSIGAPNGELPQVWIESLALNSDTLAVGDVESISVGYGAPDGNTRGGPGMIRVTGVTEGKLEGTFAGCVRNEDPVFNLDGPRRIVLGGFNATRN